MTIKNADQIRKILHQKKRDGFFDFPDISDQKPDEGDEKRGGTSDEIEQNGTIKELDCIRDAEPTPDRMSPLGNAPWIKAHLERYERGDGLGIDHHTASREGGLHRLLKTWPDCICLTQYLVRALREQDRLDATPSFKKAALKAALIIEENRLKRQLTPSAQCHACTIAAEWRHILQDQWDGKNNASAI